MSERLGLWSAQRGEKAFVFTFDELREAVIKRATAAISIGASLSNHKDVLTGIPRTIGDVSAAEVSLGAGD